MPPSPRRTSFLSSLRQSDQLLNTLRQCITWCCQWVNLGSLNGCSAVAWKSSTDTGHHMTRPCSYRVSQDWKKEERKYLRNLRTSAQQTKDLNTGSRDTIHMIMNWETSWKSRKTTLTLNVSIKARYLRCGAFWTAKLKVISNNNFFLFYTL